MHFDVKDPPQSATSTRYMRKQTDNIVKLAKYVYNVYNNYYSKRILCWQLSDSIRSCHVAKTREIRRPNADI